MKKNKCLPLLKKGILSYDDLTITIEDSTIKASQSLQQSIFNTTIVDGVSTTRKIICNQNSINVEGEALTLLVEGTQNNHALTKSQIDLLVQNVNNNFTNYYTKVETENLITATNAFINQSGADVELPTSQTIERISGTNVSSIRWGTGSIIVKANDTGTSQFSQFQVYEDEASIVGSYGGKTVKITVVENTANVPEAKIVGSPLILDSNYTPATDWEATPKKYVDDKTVTATISTNGLVKLGTADELPNTNPPVGLTATGQMVVKDAVTSQSITGALGFTPYNNKPMELIEDFTLTEELASFTRTAEPNNTAYDFCRVICKITFDFPEGSNVNSGPNKIIFFEDDYVVAQSYTSLTTYANGLYSDVLDAMFFNNRPIFFHFADNHQSATGYGNVLMQSYTDLSHNYVKINKVQFVGTETNPLPIGTNIKIYGVRN